MSKPFSNYARTGPPARKASACDHALCLNKRSILYTAGELKKHQRSHIPYRDRTHICSICNKRFLYRKDLIRHSTVHSGALYICAICGRAFGRQDNRARHIRLIHSAISRSQSASSVATKSLPTTASTLRKIFSHQQSQASGQLARQGAPAGDILSPDDGDEHDELTTDSDNDSDHDSAFDNDHPDSEDANAKSGRLVPLSQAAPDRSTGKNDRVGGSTTGRVQQRVSKSDYTGHMNKFGGNKRNSRKRNNDGEDEDENRDSRAPGDEDGGGGQTRYRQKLKCPFADRHGGCIDKNGVRCYWRGGYELNRIM